MKAPSRLQIGVLVGIAFVFIILGVRWLSSAWIEPQGDSSVFVESPTTELARANVARFRRLAPRQDLILDIAPWGGRHPNDMTLYLNLAWDKTPSPTQQKLLKEWNVLWVECTKSTTLNQQKPHIWFRPTHRERKSSGR